MLGIFTLRSTQLTGKINDLEYELMQNTQEQENLTYYSSCIGDGYVTADELAGASNASVRNNLSIFETNAQAIGTSQAQGLSISSSGTSDYTYQYDQQVRQQLATQEQQRIAAISDTLTKEKQRLEYQLQAYKAELESTEQANDSFISSTAPRYS